MEDASSLTAEIWAGVCSSFKSQSHAGIDKFLVAISLININTFVDIRSMQIDSTWSRQRSWSLETLLSQLQRSKQGGPDSSISKIDSGSQSNFRFLLFFLSLPSKICSTELAGTPRLRQRTLMHAGFILTRSMGSLPHA